MAPNLWARTHYLTPLNSLRMAVSARRLRPHPPPQTLPPPRPLVLHLSLALVPPSLIRNRCKLQ
jgi:hypothetical protein